MLVLEHKNECEFISILYLLMNSEEYQLSRKYKDKFGSRCKLAVRILIIFWNIILYTLYIVVFILTTIAYYDSKMNFSIITMLIWMVILMLSMYYAISVNFIAGVYAYIISLHIMYRFQQLQDLTEICLKRGNVFQTIRNINRTHIYLFCEKIKILITCIDQKYELIAFDT